MKYVKCRSKTPSTCPYHGKGLTAETLRVYIDAAVKKQDFVAYSVNRDALDEIEREEAYTRTLDSNLLNPVDVKSHQPLTLLTRVHKNAMVAISQERMVVRFMDRCTISFDF